MRVNYRHLLIGSGEFIVIVADGRVEGKGMGLWDIISLFLLSFEDSSPSDFLQSGFIFLKLE